MTNGNMISKMMLEIYPKAKYYETFSMVEVVIDNIYIPFDKEWWNELYNAEQKEKQVAEMDNGEYGEDAISRQDAIRIAEQGQVQGYMWEFEQLCKLPSVTPQPKTGRWIVKTYSTKMNDTYYGYECNQCHKEYNLRTNYCANCGAKMVESQESEGA